MVTWAPGDEDKVTTKLADPPGSLMVVEFGETVILAVSSSLTMTVTLSELTPL